MHARVRNRTWRSALCKRSATFCGRSSTRCTTRTWSRAGRRRGRFGSQMTPLDPESVPRLAPGCRLSIGADAEAMLLIPEGALRLIGPGRHIVELCDGERTMG